MNKRFLSQLLIFAAMGLGLLTGYASLPFLHDVAETTSTIFLKLLKLVSLPIIFLAIAATITGMRDFQEMRQMGRKVLLYTLGTTLVAAAVALALFVILDPASQAMGIPGIQESEPAAQRSYLSFLMDAIPSNFVAAFAEGNVIGIVLMALLFSVGVLFLPKEQKELLHNFSSGLFGVMVKITGLLIRFMPLAIWAFMVLLVQDIRQHYEHFHQLLLYLLAVVGANLLQGVVVLPLLLKYKGYSPWQVFKGMSPALAVAFFTKSSNAALPVTIAAAQNRIGVSPRVAQFSLPLCSVVNMNGCAAFILTTVLFVASIHGVVFSVGDLFLWVLLATLAAIGNAGVPMGCFFLTSAFLVGMDVPLYMMGLILPFYTIVDMVETTLNVWSDACVTLAVDKELAQVPAASTVSAAPKA